MKDPYLKPVIFGGLFIALLSIIFAPGIFLWAIIGGYITVRLSYKLTKEIISLTDGLLMGLFSGALGGSVLDIISFLSFKNIENKQKLISALEKNWPKDMTLPNFQEILPSVFLTTCLLIILISILFAVIGSGIGIIITKKHPTSHSL